MPTTRPRMATFLIAAALASGAAAPRKTAPKASARGPLGATVVHTHPLRLDFHLRLGLGLALSPDGKMLAYQVSKRPWNDHWIVLCDADCGKEIRRWRSDRVRDSGVQYLTFTPDGRRLAGGTLDDVVVLWDVTSGKEMFRFSGSTGGICTFSPDGRLLAGLCRRDRDLHLWDAATGREVRHFGSKPHGSVSAFSFSHDGRHLILEHWRRLGATVPIPPPRVDTDDPETYRISARVWETGTAKDCGEVGSATLWSGRRYEGFPAGLQLRQVGAFPPGWRLRHTPAGKALLFPCRRWSDPLAWYQRHWAPLFEIDRQIEKLYVSWGLGRGRGPFRWPSGDLYRLQVLQDPCVRCPAMSANGERMTVVTGMGCPEARLVIVALRDGSRAEIPLTAGEVASLWADLTDAGVYQGEERKGEGDCWKTRPWCRDPEALRAHRAAGVLVAHPARALAFLEGHVPPVSPASPRQLARLIADLDAGAYPVREKAQEELGRLGWEAAPALRRALASDCSLEQRQRIKRLLEALGSPRSPAYRETLRQLWALEVMEHLNTPQARRLVRRLAAGEPSAWLTREAQASLRRMISRP